MKKKHIEIYNTYKLITILKCSFYNVFTRARISKSYSYSYNKFLQCIRDIVYYYFDYKCSPFFRIYFHKTMQVYPPLVSSFSWNRHLQYLLWIFNWERLNFDFSKFNCGINLMIYLKWYKTRTKLNNKF